MGIYVTNLSYPEQGEGYQPYQSRQGNGPETPLAVPDLTQSIVHRTPCYNPQSETESDLCAQWRAAKAAENSANWTEWGVLASIVGISLLLWQIILTREAVEDTGNATKAMERQNELTLAAQRPWIAISCEIDRLVKSANAIHFRAVLRYYNTGDLAAESFAHHGSVQVAQNQSVGELTNTFWGSWRGRRENNHRVLLPKETYMDGINAIWARTNFYTDQNGIPYPYKLVVIAAAHYKIPGDDRWHSTERSFIVGVWRDTENFSGRDKIEVFNSNVPDMDYPLDQRTVREIESGETS
ncbi:MAG: hypothetical protein ABIM50_05410 [Novosphingobium sp.]